MPYITQAEAELNVEGFTDKTQIEKDALLLKADAYLSSKCVPQFNDVAKVPDKLKQAAYEVIRGTIAGKLFVGVARLATSEKVKADVLEVQETYAETAIELNQYEQLIDMLIATFVNCGKARVSLRERY